MHIQLHWSVDCSMFALVVLLHERKAGLGDVVLFSLVLALVEKLHGRFKCIIKADDDPWVIESQCSEQLSFSHGGAIVYQLYGMGLLSPGLGYFVATWRFPPVLITEYVI